MLKAKLKMTIPREFPGYWWLFRWQHLLCYGARLVAEDRKKETKKMIKSDAVLHAYGHYM